MKLEVGMYVRGKYYQYRGKIGKIIKNYNNDLEIAYKDGILKTNVGSFIDDNYDINGKQYKASFDIIDILECGDVIKLFMEDDIDEEDTNIFELIAINYNDNEIGVFNSDFQIEFFPIENLRGILTHEQMEQMAYKVGE